MQEIKAFDKKLESWSTVPLSQQTLVTTSCAPVGQQCPPATVTPPAVLAFEVSIYSVHKSSMFCMERAIATQAFFLHL